MLHKHYTALTGRHEGFAGICEHASKDSQVGNITIFIGPESDHWQCLSVTDSLTDGRFVNLIDVTLARVDDNSKCVKAVLLLLWMIRIVSTTVWSRQGQ